MKKIVIKNAQGCFDIGNTNCPKLTDFEIEGSEDMSVSDGYHTMDELYEHRITLYIALCKEVDYSNIEREGTEKCRPVWRSMVHSDDTDFPGWFILGISKEKGKQITYHIPLTRWRETEFAETLIKATEWDGHTSQDVLERIKNL